MKNKRIESGMNRKVIVGIGLVVVLLAVQAFFVLDLSNDVSVLKDELNLTKTELKDNINENKIETQSQLNELTSEFLKTQEDLTEQISKIKATTSADFSGIIEKAVKSVVSIQTDVSQGSGFIINEEGFVVTNVHVLNNAKFARALTYEQELEKAQLVGYNLEMDIALLKISKQSNHLNFANSARVRAGEKVIAVGNPFGLSFSVTEGIVSAIDREFNGHAAYIQTDVPLNPGNSGGPLINNEGEVIGVNNFKIGGGEGLGFALESNNVADVVNAITQQALNITIV